jgi:fatty-acid desaturase
MTSVSVVPTPPSRLNWGVILFMIVVHVGALLAVVPKFFSVEAVILCAVLYWVSGGLGITLGWHRLVTHRSFQCPKWLEYFFVFCGSLACEGGVIEWVGLHRNHHLHSDQEQDQHNSQRGFWWSHMGWMLVTIPAKAEVERLTKDINGDPIYRFLNQYFVPLQVVLAVLLYLWGGLPFVVWGVFVRLVLVYHLTWFVNSATHKFGYRTFDSGDRSTNCWWVALLTFGEGWHNNHHTYPHSARHGLQWWEFDITWITIRALQAVGLAKKIRLVESTSR